LRHTTMKKILECALLALLLAGCAAPTTVASLRADSLLRGERRLPLTTYAQVQKALFEHARACGRAPEFSLHPRNSSEAMVVYALDDPPQIQRTVLVDMQQVVGWNGEQILARAYAGHQIRADVVEQVFAAILDPTTCPAS